MFFMNGESFRSDVPKIPRQEKFSGSQAGAWDQIENDIS
jgi:hypothetical protein